MGACSKCGLGSRRWFYIYHRLHNVRFALATVVDIGARTDYDAKPAFYTYHPKLTEFNAENVETNPPRPSLLASVVDIGAGKDYDAMETRMLKLIMAPETKKTACRRKARGVSLYILLLGQCHLKLIWKPRSRGYRGHGII